MKHFVIIVNGWKPLTISTTSSIFHVAAVLDLPLITASKVKIILFLGWRKDKANTIMTLYNIAFQKG